MKIIHTEASLGWGGQEIRILEEARGLIHRGHSISILCPKESRIFIEGPRHGVPTIALNIGRKNLKGLLALRHWLRKNSVDVINTHSSTDSWLVALACRTLRNSPSVIRTRHISSPIPNNRASRWLYTKAAEHVVTTGESLRLQVIKQTGANPARVSSIPTGIDPKRFNPGNKQEMRHKLALNLEYNYVGIVATLRSWKGHLYLLEAFSVLKNLDWKLLIVGDGPYRTVLEDKTKELGLEEKVIFTGQRDNPEDWLRAMDIFCLPSYANEGVPQAILQAMLTALPIVTTNAGAITEAITDRKSGLVVEKQNSEALSSALNEFISDPELCAYYANNAKEVAMKDFTQAIMLDRMEDIFFQMSGQRMRS